MTLKRYGLGREYLGSGRVGVGAPAIIEQPSGAYVRHADHIALADEWRAEKAGLEQIVMTQEVTITEARAAVARLRDALECITQPYATPSLGDPAVLREFARAALTQQEQS